MEDIRQFEAKVNAKLEKVLHFFLKISISIFSYSFENMQQRNQGELRGMKATE